MISAIPYSYTLSLHDALPILEEPRVDGRDLRKLLDRVSLAQRVAHVAQTLGMRRHQPLRENFRLDLDRKSTRLNSSHANISYAVFCLKKKMKSIKLT